ncbi:MAG: M48 family metallopeptidase [Candidatus Aminicenantes bacterium]|nr:M48 family metallopeptidase [Candidatus Aminicenantes bacterium]
MTRIIRSRRRTVGLEINEEGQLVVRAPLYLPESEIKAVIRRHQRWIENKLVELEQRRQKKRPKSFVAGEKYLYLGQEFPLILSPRPKPALAFTGRAFILSGVYQNRGKELFQKLYQRMARAYLRRRLEQLARLNGFKFKKFRLSSARTRWGSCSAKGTISLTWRLVLAPPEIIDYVIIHELAHTREKNHSRVFWNLVAEHLPDFRQRRCWLKQNGFRLNII